MKVRVSFSVSLAGTPARRKYGGRLWLCFLHTGCGGGLLSWRTGPDLRCDWSAAGARRSERWPPHLLRGFPGYSASPSHDNSLFLFLLLSTHWVMQYSKTPFLLSGAKNTIWNRTHTTAKFLSLKNIFSFPRQSEIELTWTQWQFLWSIEKWALSTRHVYFLTHSLKLLAAWRILVLQRRKDGSSANDIHRWKSRSI